MTSYFNKSPSLQLTLVGKWRYKLDQKVPSFLLARGPVVPALLPSHLKPTLQKKKYQKLGSLQEWREDGVRHKTLSVSEESPYLLSWEVDGIVEEESWEGAVQDSESFNFPSSILGGASTSKIVFDEKWRYLLLTVHWCFCFVSTEWKGWQGRGVYLIPSLQWYPRWDMYLLSRLWRQIWEISIV